MGKSAFKYFRKFEKIIETKIEVDQNCSNAVSNFIYSQMFYWKDQTQHFHTFYEHEPNWLFKN